MRTDLDRSETEIDEYLWPLTGELTAINFDLLAEELRIRERLAEIMAHVHEMHVRPQLRRLGRRGSSAVAKAIAQNVIAGPEDGPPWVQTLKEPVPRALREEWNELARRLSEIRGRRAPATTTGR